VTSPSAPVLLQDFYVTLAAAGDVVAVERSAGDLPAMKSLQAALSDGDVTLSVAYSADELASGLVVDNAAPVGAASIQGGPMLLRIPLPVGGGGAEDIVVFAEGALPAQYRIVDHWLIVSATVGTGNVTVESELAGAGTQYLTIVQTAAGRIIDVTPPAAAPLVVKSATEGLIIRRTDNTSLAELYLLVRPEL